MTVGFDNVANPPNMELSAVLKFFNIGQDSTTADLKAAYEQYERRYHPNNNPGREAWARDMMTKLNEAYNVAGRYLRTRQVRSFYRRLFHDSADPQSQRFAFFEAFHAAVDDALQGFYTYYQFGLENVHLRHEGVRALRYHSSVRKVEDSLNRLKEIERYTPTEDDRLNVVTFYNFALAFHESMLIDRKERPTGRSLEATAYRHYIRGSQLLDDATKEAFFEEFQKGPRTASTADRMQACTNEFMVVLTECLETTWITQTVIKLHLLDVMTKLLARSSGSDTRD